MKRLGPLLISILGGILGGMIIAGSAQGARDASGVYTRPTGNPVVTGTSITSTWANTLTSDIATEIGDSLSRTGKGGMTQPLKLANGSQSAPAWSFTSDDDSGCWRVSADSIACGAGNTNGLGLTTSTLTAPLGITIGGGAEISKSLRNTVAIDLTDLAAGACFADATVTVTGAVTGAECIVGPPAAFPALYEPSCRVSASDTVLVRVCNGSSTTNGVDPASMTYSVRVFNP